MICPNRSVSATSPAHAMGQAWSKIHDSMPADDIPQVPSSFNRAWMIQQQKIDDAERKLRVLQFAVHSAVEVIKHGTAEEMRDAAGLLSAIRRITGDKP